MQDKDNISPEEKLLNLIKKDTNAAQNTQKEQPEDNKSNKGLSKPEVNPARKEKALDVTAFSKKELKNSQQSSKEAAPSSAVKPKSAVSRSIRMGRAKPSKLFSILNKLLVLVFLCAVTYIVFVYLYSYKIKLQIPEKIKGSSEGNITESAPKTSPPLSYYSDVLSRRQLFKIFEVPKPKPTGPTKPKVSLQQLLGGYTFVGIIFGDIPQAIVEERRTGQSFYLTAGQFLGEIKVERIESGKVTVSYEGETMDIRI